MTTNTKSRRLVDVPLVCGNCGSTDRRDFRYRGDNHDLEGKPRNLFGTCTKCGQSHIFLQGEWKMVGAAGGAMPNKKFPMLIPDLSEGKRKSVEERLKMLQGVMRSCEEYLRGYVAGYQNVIKFLNTMGWVHEEIKESAKKLMKVYGLPDFPGFPNL